MRSKGQEAWLPASRPANKGGRSTKGASMSGEALVVWRASSAFGYGINLPDGILERSTGSVACLTTLVGRQILAQQRNADLARHSDTILILPRRSCALPSATCSMADAAAANA